MVAGSWFEMLFVGLNLVWVYALLAFGLTLVAVMAYEIFNTLVNEVRMWKKGTPKVAHEG